LDVNLEFPMQFRPPSFGVILLLVVLGFLLLLSAYGVFVAFKIGGGSHMTIHGYVALGLAVVLTALLGGGLMGLAFYSNRHGYDDAQGRDEF
jgi:hypothetical protein